MHTQLYYIQGDPEINLFLGVVLKSQQYVHGRAAPRKSHKLSTVCTTLQQSPLLGQAVFSG